MQQQAFQEAMGQLLRGILLVGRMVPHPPPVNAEH